ncbi:hypothetical protein E3N88_28222 [Mikania micrantha]|uniref:Aminotransferase-like plant mobile domain-containing protein n=1 Tax=Mikania micrantha TaxID=192012 RepID=A0A5N6MZG6_9ASTR|nr:hypothetical protein E3N88_28222 [Mikania micrantha]
MDPYDSIVERLPFICRSSEASWTCECFLILSEVVEPYHSSRVMRQFGLLQNIPNPIHLTMDQQHTIHNLNRGGKLNKDWLRHHQQYVSSWNQRLTNTIDGHDVLKPTVSVDYMRWYRSRTVLYITNPGSEEVNMLGFQNDGGAYQLMMDGMVQIFQSTRQFISDNPETQNQFQRIQDTVSQVMRLAHEVIDWHYQHTLQPNSEFGVTPQHHMDYSVTPNVVPMYEQQQSSFNYFVEDPSTYEQPRYSDVSPIPLNLSLGMMPSQEDVNENNQCHRRQTRPPPCGTGHRLSHHDH